jgi:hypothetical protein
MKRVVVQQPQFLPWAGLWHKVVSADVYVVYAGVKFDQGDHQHRVTLDGKWLSAPVEGHSRNKMICDVQLSDPDWPAWAAQKLKDRFYHRSVPYHKRLTPIVSALAGYHGKFLLDLNHLLFIEMAKLLGLSPEIHVDTTIRNNVDKIEKLNMVLREYAGLEGFTYLQGAGGLGYMNHDSLVSPVQTWFQEMQPDVPSDTALQLIAYEPDPLTVIKDCAVWKSKDGTRFDWRGVAV